MTEQQNYTPHDILGFGHRAESEGRYAYAHQIYSHLAHYYANEEVGAAARAGLGRIGAAAQTQQTAPSVQAQHVNGQATTGYASTQPSVPQSAGAMTRTQQQTPAGRTSQSGQPASNKSTSYTGNYANEAYQDDELADVSLPFRSGVLTMRLAQALGWLAIVCGVIALVMEIAMTGAGSIGAGSEAAGAAGHVASVWLAYLMPAGLLVAGIVLVLVSQIARASFEAANSTRQLLILERGRAGL